MAQPPPASELPPYWVHDLDPFIWRISGEIGIRWYGMAYVAAVVLGALLVAWWARRGRSALRATEIQDFALIVGLAMVLGGRLGYVLFYDPSLLGFIPTLPWWGVLALNDGGMSSHGGIIGLFLGTWYFARTRQRDLLVLADTVCAVAPLGVIFGRLANFINGELYGRPIAGHVPWAVIFPSELDAPPGLVGSAARAWQQAHWQAAVPRHPSQLYAALLEGLLPLVVVCWLHGRHRRPGLTMAALLALYGIGRFIDEFFREPDRGQPGFDAAHPALLGFMTKGQALTIPVILIGVALMVWTLRRAPRPEAYLQEQAPAAGG